MITFPATTRPYNAAVLPTGIGEFYVYMVPGQTDADIYPLGGDVRYLISRDGERIIEKRQLHNSIIEFSTKDVESNTITSGFHTAVLDDVPEDTDVFHVLARRPHVPELILTPTYAYRIHTDGTIAYLSTREIFLKVK